MTTRLMHFSHSGSVTLVASKTQEPTAGMKPIGLWVSVEGRGDGWSDFCRSDYPGGLGSFAHEVVLSTAANILRIKTPTELDAFTTQYAEVPEHFLNYGNNDLQSLLLRMSIAWYRVAQKFSGILIDPYIYERRLTPHSQWYYGWDCASGCIWDPAAIESIKVAQWSPKVEA